MPIVLARFAVQNRGLGGSAKTSSQVIEQQEYVRTPPTTARIEAMNERVILSRQIIDNNIPSTYFSAKYKKVVPLGHCEPLGKDADLLPIPIPTLAFAMTKGKPQDSMIKQYGITKERIRNDEIFLVPNPTLYAIRDISSMQYVDPNCPAPANTLNIAAARAFVTASRVLYAVLTVSQSKPHIANTIGEEKIPIKHIKKRKHTGDTLPEAQGSPLARPTDSSELMDLDTSDQSLPGSTDTTAYIGMSNEVTLRSPITSLSDFKHPGNFIVFRSELSEIDFLTVPRLIQSAGLRFLGRHPEECLRNLASVSAGWGIAARTKSGDQFAHLARCLELSLDSDTFPIPVIANGIYSGTFVLGNTHVVISNGAIIKPLDKQALKVDYESCDTHGKAMRVILEITGDLDLEEGEDPNERLNTMRRLREHAIVSSLSEEDRQRVLEAAGNLSFPTQRYWGHSASFIGKAISYLQDPTLQIPDDAPLHPSALFESSRLTLVLGAFGDSVPTFDIEGAPRILVKNGTENAPAMNLTARPRSLKHAVENWENMIKTSSLRNGPKAISKSLRDKGFSGKEKTVLWSQLMQLITGGRPIDAITGEISTEESGHEVHQDLEI